MLSEKLFLTENIPIFSRLTNLSRSLEILAMYSCTCGSNAQGSKAVGRMNWCSICDHNKSRRRCQSEGLYQESDPLKELNRCCDKGCDYIHYSPHHSQIKKSPLELDEKKVVFSDIAEMDISDVYHTSKKHHMKLHKEKCFFPPKNNQFQNVQDGGVNINLPSLYENSRKLPVVSYNQSKDINVEKTNLIVPKLDRLRSTYSKYCIGDSSSIELLSSQMTRYSEQDTCSSEMMDKYIREMEILRSKLNLLKGEMACDGKRLRQRSESEPGFPGIPGGVPKRARDNSPKLKYGCRKLPLNPPINQTHNKFQNKQNPRCRESRSLLSSKQTSSVQQISKINCKAGLDLRDFHNQCNEVKNKEDVSDSDLEGSMCDEELPSQEDGDINISEDDNHSVLSITSVSTDSITPSLVGETLGSITLNETSKNDLANQIKDFEKQSFPKPVPANSHCSEESQKLAQYSNPFRVSLFSHVPPYVNFFMHDCKGPVLPSDVTRHLKWKLSSITPIVIRRTLTNSGFKLVRSELNGESNDWTGQWGKHMKSFVFKTLKDFQKLNHFPGTFQIGRKDRLWKNLFRLMAKFGKKEFGFIPKTYILPQDSKILRAAWEKASISGKGQWIIKPPAAARGTGIKVVHRWGQIPKKRPLIVQKYIAKPYLINGSKFDLRLYVLMTSIHPLRIYLYDDGLVRFASVKYSEDVEYLSDRFMHLTNYSINKLSSQYCANEDASSCRGHKWTLKALWTYFTKQGINVKLLRKNLIDLVIKTVISGESNINILTKNNLPSRYCSYELFGVDVLLDHNLKPWLLEVNISPSLHSASPLDLAVKGPLVRELLNIAGFQIPGKFTKEQEDAFLKTHGLKDKIHSLCYDKRIYWTTLSKEERLKQETCEAMTRDEYLDKILEELTPDDVRHLIQYEDELTQLSRFEKVFPTSRTYVYHQFFETPRYYNMMFDAWETKYHKNRAEGIKVLESLCQQKLHLNVAFNGSKLKSSPSQNEASGSPATREGKSDDEKDSESGKEDLKQVPSRLTSMEMKKPKIRLSGRPSFVSKSVVRTSLSLDKRSKIRSPRTEGEYAKTEELLDCDKKDTCEEYNVTLLADLQERNHETDPIKQFSSCKLENSIINDALTNGENNISSPKQIANVCIKMNTSS